MSSRPILIATLSAFIIAGIFHSAGAQTNTAPNQPPPLISAQDKAKIDAARQQVFASHPELKTEEDSLKAQHHAQIQPGSTASADDKASLLANWITHSKAMRAAMIQVDPSLQAVFTELDQSLTPRRRLQNSPPAGT